MTSPRATGGHGLLHVDEDNPEFDGWDWKAHKGGGLATWTARATPDPHSCCGNRQIVCGTGTICNERDVSSDTSRGFIGDRGMLRLKWDR